MELRYWCSVSGLLAVLVPVLVLLRMGEQLATMTTTCHYGANGATKW